VSAAFATAGAHMPAIVATATMETNRPNAMSFSFVICVPSERSRSAVYEKIEISRMLKRRPIVRNPQGRRSQNHAPRRDFRAVGNDGTGLARGGCDRNRLS